MLAIHNERLEGEWTNLQISIQKTVLSKYMPSLVILLTVCKGADPVGGLETERYFGD